MRIEVAIPEDAVGHVCLLLVVGYAKDCVPALPSGQWVWTLISSAATTHRALTSALDRLEYGAQEMIAPAIHVRTGPPICATRSTLRGPEDPDRGVERTPVRAQPIQLVDAEGGVFGEDERDVLGNAERGEARPPPGAQAFGL